MLTPTRTRRFQKLVTPLTQPARSSLSWIQPLSSTEDQPSSHEKRLQELLEAQLTASQDQKTLIQQQKKVEIDAPYLVELTTEAYVKFKSDNDTYRQKNGNQKIIDRIQPAKLKIIAEYFAECELDELVNFTDLEISTLLDKQFDVDISTSYSTVLSGLAMTGFVFSRTAIQKYTTSFLQSLTENPNFRNPAAGGADEEVINQIFLNGLQTEHFRSTLGRYNLKDVKSTYRAIKIEIPVYQRALDSGMVPPVQRIEKAFQATLKPKTSSGPTSTASALPSQSAHPCHNCDQWGHTWYKCPQKANCLKCPSGTIRHYYWDSDKCLHRKNISKANYDAKPKAKANSAMTLVEFSEKAAMELEIQQLRARAEKAEEVKRYKKKIYLDSAANTHVISDLTHVDPHTSPSFGRSEEYSGVETASQEVLAVEGLGQIMGMNGVICTGAGASLVSIGKACDELTANCLVTSSEAIVYANSPASDVLFNNLKNHITSTKTRLFVASRNKDLMYEIPHVPSPPIESPVSNALLESPGALSERSSDLEISDIAATETVETAGWTPTETVLEQHRLAYAAYYWNTAQLPRLRDLVRFFHEAWDHPSQELMCKIVDNKMLASLPDELTSKVIRKYFPQCEACPAANMSQKPIPREASDRELVPGEKLQIDIKVFANNSKALKHRRAFGRYTGALTAIDLSTRYKLGKLIKSHASLEVQLEELRVDVHAAGYKLRVLRLDNEFVTAPIKRWAGLCEPPIELQPCIPHEHHSIGDIERFNQTLENAVFKKMYGRRHLSVQYWGMAYEDYIMKANFMGSVHGPMQCPYQLWTGKHPDALKLPMIPFGSVVMAHVPLDQQTTDGPRSVLHHAVGTSLGHLGGLRLLNPVTKRIVVRRTYKVLGPEPQPYTIPVYEISADGDVTEQPVSVDTNDLSGDVNEYKYLINTIHLDPDDGEYYKVTDVVEETYDDTEGPLIVAYRRHVSKTGKHLKKTSEDDYPIHIGDIVQYTAEHAIARPDQISKESAKLVAHHVLAYRATSTPSGKQPEIDWSRRLPRTLQQVLNMSTTCLDRAGFLEATAAEINSLRDMGTWDPDETLDEDQMKTSKVGMSRCVFSKKYHPDGTFDKYKCRIVFRGDKWYDLYCNKTYAGCVMSETVRLMLAVAATEDMEIGCLDVKTAFLYGDVPEDQYIYMRRPAGLTDIDMPAVVRLRKCLYGLPHAPATFRRHSDATIRSLGFTPTVSDPRLYVRLLEDGTKAYVAVHVDDFGVAATTVTLKEEIMAAIQEVYRCVESDLGFYLGMKLVRDRVARTITISQPGYMEDVREEYGITSTHGPLTPMVDKERELESDTNLPLDAADIKLYERKVGSALWPAIGTRPDIQLAINLHSRHTKSPLRGDMVTLDRLLEYLVNTPDLGLVLGGLGVSYCMPLLMLPMGPMPTENHILGVPYTSEWGLGPS